MNKPNTTEPTEKQLATLDPIIVAAAEAHAAVTRATDDKAEKAASEERNGALKRLLYACEAIGISKPEASVIASVVGTAANLSVHGTGARTAYSAVANGKFLLDCLKFHAARRNG